MALRKNDLFNIDALAGGDRETLETLQNLARYCGYNWWSKGPAWIMGAARRIKYEFAGKVPREPAIIRSFLGVARKVAMLILQDAFPKEVRMRGIVWDRHVEAVVYDALGWTTVRTSEQRRAQDVESWLNEFYYRDLNEGCAGLRQLWKQWSNHALMEEVAREVAGHDGWWLLRQVTAGVAAQGAPKATLKITAEGGRVVLAKAMAVEGFVVGGG